MVSVTGIPRGSGALDDSVRIIVDLPAGSGNGPQVSDNLRTWGVRSAVAYRLLINLAFHWHEPGRTHYPVGRGKNRHWLQSDNPEHYPPLTDAQLVAFSLPHIRDPQAVGATPKGEGRGSTFGNRRRIARHPGRGRMPTYPASVLLPMTLLVTSPSVRRYRVMTLLVTNYDVACYPTMTLLVTNYDIACYLFADFIREIRLLYPLPLPLQRGRGMDGRVG